MGFGVSARDQAETTLFGFVFSHFILQNLYFSHIVNREIANLARYTRSSDDNFSSFLDLRCASGHQGISSLRSAIFNLKMPDLANFVCSRHDS